MAGAALTLQVDTSAAVRPSLWLSYLTSHEGMGVVGVECAQCACAANLVLDGRSAVRQSTQERREIVVSPHARCELRLTVLNRSASHRFKLSRLVVEGDGTAVRRRSR